MPYIIIGIIIIIIVVILYFFAYPAIFLITSNEISGYWVDIFGKLYKINSIEKYSFNIVTNGIKINGKIMGTVYNNTIKIQMHSNNAIGHVNLKNGTIYFNNGEEWYKTSF
jgi:hypothetical protein